MIQASARPLILQMSQDPAGTAPSRRPQMAIHVQVWGSLSRPAINQKTMLHSVVSINTQWPLLANKNSVSFKNVHCLSLVDFLGEMFFENSSVFVQLAMKQLCCKHSS